MIEKVVLSEKFAQFNEHWSPKIAARIDEFAVKIAKVQGEFVWHMHDDDDELFMVVHGTLIIKLRDQDDIVLRPGEIVVIPKGVEHCPVAEEEAHIVMMEREAVVNTGNVENERTVKKLDTI
jgi:mannose-6-phosphate isomerase-like protein (cupin superfamily)